MLLGPPLWADRLCTHLHSQGLEVCGAMTWQKINSLHLQHFRQVFSRHQVVSFSFRLCPRIILLTGQSSRMSSLCSVQGCHPMMQPSTRQDNISHSQSPEAHLASCSRDLRALVHLAQGNKSVTAHSDYKCVRNPSITNCALNGAVRIGLVSVRHG